MLTEVFRRRKSLREQTKKIHYAKKLYVAGPRIIMGRHSLMITKLFFSLKREKIKMKLNYNHFIASCRPAYIQPSLHTSKHMGLEWFIASLKNWF